MIMNDCFQTLTRLYLDKATLVWNGNAVTGQDALAEFFESLPSSEFTVHTLDCQPVHGMQNKTTFVMLFHILNLILYLENIHVN